MTGTHEIVACTTRRQDLPDVWAFENDVFGDDNVSWETLLGWWWRYSRFALHVRNEHGRVVGTFDASPIEQDAFEALLEGRCTERDLSIDAIRPPRRDEVVAQWCVTSLTTRGSMAERAEILGALLSAIVVRLDTLLEVGWPSRWCAVAQSAEGRRMLERAGFRRYRAASPIFVCELNSRQDMRAFRAKFATDAEVLSRLKARRLVMPAAA